MKHYRREFDMMTRNELLIKLAGIFEVNSSELTDQAGPRQIPGWDSVSTLDVISLLDDGGAGELTTEDVANFRTIGAIVSFAKARGMLSD